MSEKTKREAEPVGEVFFANGFLCMRYMDGMASKVRDGDKLYTHPASPCPRCDELEEANIELARRLNEELSGPTFMGEPVLTKHDKECLVIAGGNPDNYEGQLSVRGKLAALEAENARLRLMQESALKVCNQLDEVVLALPMDYLDPPDGGDVSLGEQVSRMKAHRDELKATVANMTERIAELEEAKKWLAAGQQNIAIVAKLEKAQATIAAQSAALAGAMRCSKNALEHIRYEAYNDAMSSIGELRAAIDALPTVKERLTVQDAWPDGTPRAFDNYEHDKRLAEDSPPAPDTKG